jgi:hypothetical protein
LRIIVSNPAANSCAPLKAQPWGDVIRCAGLQVSSATILSEVGERMGAPLARTVPWSAPPGRTRRAGQGPASWPTDKVEAARGVGAIPLADEAARVAVAGTPVEVEASPPVAARYTLAAVAEASPAVAPVQDTTNAAAKVQAVTQP